MDVFGQMCYHFMLAIGALAVISFSSAKSFQLRGEKLRYLMPRNRIKTDRPVIGIVTQETNGRLLQFGGQYLVSVYVKFLESAGARAVPIFVNSTMDEIEKIFNSINGVILPGGHVKLNQSRYTLIGRKLFELAVKAYDEKREVFPIWGECLGLELIALLVSSTGNLDHGQYDPLLFSPTDARNISLKVDLPSDYRTSKLLGFAPSHIIKYLTTQAITYNNHFRGITPETYKKDNKLRTFFQIVSTNKDRKGKEFISTMEARAYPFYMFQWHPAKPQFEWSSVKDIKHTQEAIITGQYFADFFVNQARLSSHRFSSTQEEKRSLIYNYNPVYTGDIITMLQCYFWS